MEVQYKICNNFHKWSIVKFVYEVKILNIHWFQLLRRENWLSFGQFEDVNLGTGKL